LRLKGILCFAVPNGGSRFKLEAVNLKREGVLAGVADLVVLLPKAKTIFLEVKAPKKYQQPTQKEFERKVKELGHDYYVVRSIEDVQEIL
jgi:hypothetical protein